MLAMSEDGDDWGWGGVSRRGVIRARRADRDSLEGLFSVRRGLNREGSLRLTVMFDEE